MPNGFTKLFSSIITSSIWSEDDKTRLMWITMLASADPTGYVSGSIPGMAAIARMSLQDAKQSIAALCAPDQYSRSKDYEGRRLIETDGGWIILNYLKYRQRRDPEKRREQNLQAQRRYREKQGVIRNKPKSANVSPRQKSEDRSQKTDKPPTGERAPSVFVKPSVQEVNDYAGEVGYDTLNGATFCDYYESCGWVVGRKPMRDWKAAVRTWQARDKKQGGESLSEQFARMEKEGQI